MRVVAVGCEYTGVTTLLEGLMAWGKEKGINHHLDDHFSIPDYQNLSEEDQEAMVNLTPNLKERFQRFQIVYHIHLLNYYEHILLGGFHIEEEVYGPLYYYADVGGVQTRKHFVSTPEAHMPVDTILVHLTASKKVILKRLEENPHKYTIIKSADIEMLLDRFS